MLGAGTRLAGLAVAGAGLLLLGACSDDPEPGPRPQESTESTGSPGDTTESASTRHSDAELVEALPTSDEERNGLAVFESCTDFSTPGDCLEQEPGTVQVNLSDGMNQGLLFTVAKKHSDTSFEERGAACPDGTIDDPPQELDSGVEIPGRQGTGERTPWEHRGWSGWVCEADYTQIDSDGVTKDSYSLTLLLATNGHHQISLQTAADVDVKTWAQEYVDRLEG